MNTAEELWANVHKTKGCWFWTKSLRSSSGYGQLRWRGRIRYAHHVAYELTHGPIPSGKHVLHHCDVKHCCKPKDIYAGTREQNGRSVRHFD